MEKFEKRKFYPIGTEVLVDGKECVVEEHGMRYSCTKCVFYDLVYGDCREYLFKCGKFEREDGKEVSLTLKSLL